MELTRRAAFSSVGLFLLFAAGCHPSARRSSLDNSDSGRTITVQVDDEIEVTLQTIGPGQYGSPDLSSTAVSFLGAAQVGNPNPAGPTQLYRFEAVASGQTVITIPHVGGLPDGAVVPAFTLTVVAY